MEATAKVLSLVAVFALLSPEPGRAQSVAALAGAWTLDAAASDTLPTVDRQNSRRLPIGVRVGPTGGRFPAGSPRSIHDPRLMHDALDAIGARPDSLVIAIRDSVVVISRDGAPPTASHSDGRKRELLVRPGLAAEARAEWTDGGLRIERKLESGAAIVERFSLDEDGRLVVEIEASGPIPRRIELRWIYERSDRPPTSGSTASRSSS